MRAPSPSAILCGLLGVPAVAGSLLTAAPGPAPRRENATYFKTDDVAGVRLFYREAGDPSKPAIVLLHGFPSSSHSFHDLIPRLADRFHVLAPDYPGMGYSDAPAPAVLHPNFDDVDKVIDAFIAQRTSGPVILYMHDIGGQIGMRIAAAHPERIAGLIFQNFTHHREGLEPRAPESLRATRRP